MPTTTINLTGQALSKTDDTNVILTLGGTPLTALLKATSIAVSWSGTLAPARGGIGSAGLGSALQLFRTNAAGTAFESVTPSTTIIAEGTNLYYTDARVRATALTGLSISGSAITSTDTVLSAFGKVQNQINSLVGGVNYQGTWNATTNSPALSSGSGTKGYYYVVSVAGSTNLDGITDWKLGDWVIFNGATWEKVDNTDAVISVNGYTGAVVLVKADVGLGNVENTALSTWSGSASITNLGTIGSGIWQGTVVATAYGGLGANMTAGAVGAIPYSTSTTAYGSLAGVATGSVLISGGVGVAPSWSASPTISNLTFSRDAVPTDRIIKVTDQSTSNTAGNTLNIIGAAGNGTGSNGYININSPDRTVATPASFLSGAGLAITVGSINVTSTSDIISGGVVALNEGGLGSGDANGGSASIGGGAVSVANVANWTNIYGGATTIISGGITDALSGAVADGASIGFSASTYSAGVYTGSTLTLRAGNGDDVNGDIIFGLSDFTEWARFSPTGAFTLGVASTKTGAIVLQNATNANTLIIQSGVSAASRVYTLPTNFGAAGSALTDAAGNGTLSWAVPSSGAALSAITAAAAGNTIDNTNYAQEWQWSTLGAGNGLKLSSTSTAAASNTSTLLNIARSGANATASQTVYGQQTAVTNTGTTNTNVGGYFSASGATNNYGLIVNAGSVGIGTTAPTQLLHIYGTSANIFLDRPANTAGNYAFTRWGTAGVLKYFMGMTADGGGVNVDKLGIYDFAVSGILPTMTFTGGLVGVGIMSPNFNLHINSTTYSLSQFTTSATGAATTDGLVFGYVDGDGVIVRNKENTPTTFFTNDTERWRIAETGTFSNTAATGTAYIHLKAGTATASTAPLKLTTGTVNTAAEAGAFEYTTPQLFFTNGGAQRQEIPQIQQSRVAAQIDYTTNTTLANITGLTATLVAGKTYRFEATLYTAKDAVGGEKYAISGTCTATAIIYEILAVDNTGNLNTITSQKTALDQSAGQASGTTGYTRITGTITVANAGTLTAQFSQNASNGTSSVLRGSTFITTEIL